MDDEINNETGAILATLVMAGVAFFLLMLWVTMAPASTLCLSKKEARELWPRSHLYWYSSSHCWSNRRGPPRGLRIDKIRDNHAEDTNKSDRQPNKMVRVIPITKPQAWQNDFEDYCCWPSMQDALDVNHDRERAFELLAKKMRGLQ